MKAYALVRNVHLALGLCTAAPLLVYAVSAAQMAYPIVRPAAVETHTTVEVPAGVERSPRRLAQWLMDAHGLRGDLTGVTERGASLDLTIVRPGTSYRVRFDGGRRAADITTSRLNTVGMLNRLHHAAGLRHEYWALDLWGWLLLLVSAALLALSATGVVLWFERHDMRRTGTIVLAAGLAWGGTLLWLVRTA